MNKTDIDWADRSWNPVSGCLHDCPYCYARNQARRFAGHWNGDQLRTAAGDGSLHDVKEPLYRHTTGKNREKPVHSVIAPYPFGFDPTFHRYRLGEPARIKASQTIFVGSMCDLFGSWVPDEWIKAVFAACQAAPQHRYLFLTKNPSRYNRYFSFHDDRPANFFFGASATTYNDMVGIRQTLAKSLNFLSLEPLHGDVDLGKFTFENPGRLDWVIVGAETGNRKGRVVPDRSWIESIVNTCRREEIAVFMKGNLRASWGEDLIQEYPWRR